jgi:hypothetical protein
MKRKLKLAIEDLSVESFRIARARDVGRGTVRANSEYDSYNVCEPTAPGSDSYGENTCGEYTCDIRGCTGQTQGGWDRWWAQDAAMC